MTAKLIAIDGPARGQVFPIEGLATIGRDASNGISLNDASVSRRHCEVRGGQTGFVLSDLDSHNGTFVNGRPIQHRDLRPNDQIRLGASTLVFALEDVELPEAAPARAETDWAFETRTVVELSRDHSAYRSLLKLAAAISGIRDVASLSTRLLQLVCELVEAERGRILLLSDGPAAQQIPAEVFERVCGQGKAILSNDGAPRVMAAPIAGFDKPAGAIYVESASRFEQDQLELLTAIGVIAGMAFENAVRWQEMEAENSRLREEISLAHDMVGESARMRDVYQVIARVAPTNSTVLITGESGTGKELVARAIYRNSPRATKPFVAVNCAALTESLLESELFGHEKGAFTGAIAQKKGRMEIADSGVLFLDEIGEMPLPLQVKLLRALQQRAFERVGGTRTIQVDVRLIAATNRDLREAMASGVFRQDLYYRLNVVSIAVPPLRERRDDIPLLASYFADTYGNRVRGKAVSISPEARACLMAYDWPGNVRELENAIERSVVLGSTARILPEDLPETLLESAPAGAAGGAFHDAVRREKERLILRALEESGGSYTEAAKQLGLNSNYLHRLIRNLNLKSEIKRGKGS